MLALLITGCASSLMFKQTGSSSTKVKPSPIISSFLGRRKLSMQPKFVAAQKMLLKTETQQTFVNGLLGFITLVFILRWKRVYCHNNCMSCPSIWATLSALLINILLGSFQLFLHRISLQVTIPSKARRGRLHYPRREAVVASRTD